MFLRLTLSLWMAAAAWAAGVDGTWTGTGTIKVDGETNTFPVTLVLKSAGDKVEGTAQAGDEATPISAGQLDGAKIYFEVKTESDGVPVLIRARLELKGDRLIGTFTRESSGRSIPGEASFDRKP